MLHFASQSIVFVSVVGVGLTLQPVFPSHNALCFRITGVELSLDVLELTKVHVFDALSAESHVYNQGSEN